ncbi:hypothetical protein L1887_12067 [Cichorium endivia]|nr:hypothetical protein L1887_12067 [Cichorium endivia]
MAANTHSYKVRILNSSSLYHPKVAPPRYRPNLPCPFTFAQTSEYTDHHSPPVNKFPKSLRFAMKAQICCSIEKLNRQNPPWLQSQLHATFKDEISRKQIGGEITDSYLIGIPNGKTGNPRYCLAGVSFP